MWKFQSWHLVCGVAGIFSLATPALGQTAANYPSKPVRVILPYAPGGGLSTTMRLFADKLGKQTGQAFIVDNRPGGNTVIGSQAAARATPDGYTLLAVTSTHVINHWTQANLPYDTIKDFAPISTIIRNDWMILVHPSVPAKTLKEFIEYAKKNEDKLNASVTLLGGVNHLDTLLFMKATGTKLKIVPYKGGSQAVTDLIAGVTQITIKPTAFATHVRAGKLRAFAISGDKRNPVVPDVPTFAEAGLKDFVVSSWYALLAPSATPRDIIQKLNSEVGKAQTSREVAGPIAKQGDSVFPNSVAGTEAWIRAQWERYGKVVKEFNVKASQ